MFSFFALLEVAFFNFSLNERWWWWGWWRWWEEEEEKGLVTFWLLFSSNH